LFGPSILIEKDEFDRFNGLEKAKDIWDTLQRAHEGTKTVKKAKRQLIEGQLDRFFMFDDEDPQEMYNQLKKPVNKVRAYGSKRWGDRMVIDRMLWAYAVKDTTVISLIQQDPTFKRMTLDDVLGKIINHEMLVEEAQHVKNLSKGMISSKKQDIAFKAIKKSKSKKIVEESSSEEEVDDSDDESTGYDPKAMALFIRRFSKMMGKQKFVKGDKKDKFKSKTKWACYNCGKYGHYIANYPHEPKEEDDDKKKRKKEKSYQKDKHYKKKTYGETNIGKEWDSNDESSDSDSDGVATVAIKGSSSSSSKSLFPNLNKGKHTCLMVKESKKKVKSKSAPPKYVSSDDELDSSNEEDEEIVLNAMCKNPKERMKGLLKEVEIRDELLDQ
jgi:hypothetical protein